MDDDSYHPPPPTTRRQYIEQSNIGRAFSIARKSSTRKNNIFKRSKPDLSINTNVSRHRAALPPQEVKPIPEQALPEHPNPLQSPSRFPTAYLNNNSKRNTIRASPSAQDLYFAPPPGSATKRSSSVYSRPYRDSKSKIKAIAHLQAQHPPLSRQKSDSTTFEEDLISSYNRSRANSRATNHSNLEPSSAVSTTRTWWSLIMTPLQSKSRVPSFYRANDEPDVPAIPSQYTHVFPTTAPNNNQNKQTHKSTQSSATITTNPFSPDDRDIPIMLDTDSPKSKELLSSQNSIRSRKDSESTTVSSKSPPGHRMPFLDVRSPPQGQDDFSPSGMEGTRGHIPMAPNVVNVVVPAAQSVDTNTYHAHNHTYQSNGDHRYEEEEEGEEPRRRSIRDTITRGVRFLNVRSPKSPRSPQNDNVTIINHNQYGIPQTPKSVRFAPHEKFYGRPESRATTITEFEEFEVDDKPAKGRKKKRGCFSLKRNKNKKDEKDNNQKKSSLRRRCCICCLCLVIFGILVLVGIILMAVLLSRNKNKSSSIEINWQNITNYPGVPTGQLTVARPNLVSSQPGCVAPNTMWSCAVPKEDQASILPNDPDQPNFVFDILWNNSTTAPITTKRSASGPVEAVYYLRNLVKRSITSNPVPPTLDDQNFLGNTTDNNTVPYAGEATPFYVSLIQPGVVAPNFPTKVKRSPQGSSASVIPNLATFIPVPVLNQDGTPPPANLLPSSLPVYQPLRLYNRGLQSEHYGFYTYYDRSIFLKSNMFNSSSSIIPADQNGGSTQLGANVRCTWSQTRILVQIWTNMNSTKIPKASSGSNIANGDFIQPGSFPYPVTITIDRHGGNANNKMLYCFALEADGVLNTAIAARQFQGEDRSFGGSQINPSQGPFSDQNPTNGIDGGTGGCYCKWQNFM